MNKVELIDVSKAFGPVDVIHDVNLTIADGELVVFVGPSGCGKSTLLRLICGLEHLSRGEIRIAGKSMRSIDPAKREVAMVFQSYALYPHMSVAENMAFALRMAGVARSERAQRVREAARILQLDHLLERLPKQLSGGQRQRVAIGRAIVRHPRVFLFDEPLSNLDAELRVQMRLEISALHRQLGATMVYVTHDQVEAMTMADRIVVLRQGRVEQVGTPMELYSQPDNIFVAGFIGSPRMNFLKARVQAVNGQGADIALEGNANGRLCLAVEQGRLAPGDAVTVGLRPEHFLAGEQAQFPLDVEIEMVECLGGTSFLHAPSHPAGSLVIETRAPAPRRGPLTVGINPAAAYVFDSNGREVGRRPPG